MSEEKRTRRQTLFDFSCIYGDAYRGAPVGQCFHSEQVPCKQASRCIALPVYKQVIALRKAVLGDMMVGDAADVYRRAADLCEAIDDVEDANMLNALADAVEGMA